MTDDPPGLTEDDWERIRQFVSRYRRHRTPDDLRPIDTDEGT